MRIKVRAIITQNWGIKLAAVFLSLMLYVAVASQQPASQLFSLKLALDLPPGRTSTTKLPTVALQVTGRRSELLKLLAAPPVIRKAVPDTLSGATWLIRLQPSDVQLPKGADVRIDDIVPRDVEVVLDAVSRKEVRIVPRVRVTAESGYVVLGGLSITPSIARIVGPEQNLAAIESVTTVPVDISGVTGPFAQSVALDTAPLGILRVVPKKVEISGNIGAITERSFSGIPVETGAGALRTFVVSPARVSVAVRGPEERIQALTRDSLRVVAHLAGRAAAGAYAHLTVIAPRGIRARAIPDSVALRRRS